MPPENHSGNNSADRSSSRATSTTGWCLIQDLAAWFLAGRWHQLFDHQTRDWPKSRVGPIKVFTEIKTIAMGRCFAWPNAITALAIILMVAVKTIGVPMILSEEIVLTKRKMLQIHMVTFSFESSRKERLWQISTQINSEVINFFSQYQYHIHQKSY